MAAIGPVEAFRVGSEQASKRRDPLEPEDETVIDTLIDRSLHGAALVHIVRRADGRVVRFRIHSGPSPEHSFARVDLWSRAGECWHSLHEIPGCAMATPTLLGTPHDRRAKHVVVPEDFLADLAALRRVADAVLSD